MDSFSIEKSYAEQLRSKVAAFKSVSKTKKAVFLTIITTYGLDKTKYVDGLVQNEITMDDLFVAV